MTAVGCKLTKLQQRLQSAIEERRFYEAHQIYKTVYFRCITRRNYVEALKYLYSGADFLLTNKQWESGIELASMVVEVYTKSKMELTEVHLNQMCDLLKKMNPSEDRSNFIQKATGLLNNHKSLLCGFNEQLARIFWQEGSFTEARFRIMLSFNGHAVGSFLIALHQRYGLRSEIDLFITQAVLQFLCMRQAPAAVLTFYTYTRGHPRLEPGPPFTRFPLLNFVWFLMLAIERKCTVSVFSLLCEKYGPQIRRDSTYLAYLDKIGQLYFGIKPASGGGMNNLFSNLLKMLSGADEGDIDSSSDGPDPIPSTSNELDGPSSTIDNMCVDDVD
ncbi:hypothetical protein CRM22_002930 [Opisthorchis felineus]|uniref:Golgi to ER traffic protein 4 homolog n=1 Tax=Opisthorchis felineus TaxID=147828 RepID=A0A4S2M893_OPIFE|nr:hypothetical protein CRM22_002930 [Opisthorchis felineus]